MREISPRIAISWIMHLRSASALANCHLVMLCHGEEYVSPIVEQPSFSHHVVCRRIHIVVAFSASVRRAPAPEEKDSEQTGLPHFGRSYLLGAFQCRRKLASSVSLGKMKLQDKSWKWTLTTKYGSAGTVTTDSYNQLPFLPTLRMPVLMMWRCIKCHGRQN